MTLINPSQLEPNCSIIMVSGANRSIGAAITTVSHAEGNSLSLAARGPSGVPETANVIVLIAFSMLRTPNHPRSGTRRPR